MKIRIYNTRILTLDSGFDIIDGEIHITDDKISYIGADKGGGGSFDREINGENKLVMPTFKNAHTHSAMTFLRSYTDDYPLDRWLSEKVFPMEAKLEGDDVYWLSLLAFMEYVSGGIGACMDMYYFPECTARAASDFGMRAVMVGAVNDFQESAEKLEEYYLRYNDFDELVSYRLGFHAEYTTSEGLMREIADLSHKYRAPVFTHAHETKSEVDGCIDRYGMTPTALFERLGLFDYGGAVYHGVWLSDSDMDILKRNNIAVVTNPASNLKLASGIAPLTKIAAKGINIAIGTDGPSSNNCLDMFREMFLAAALPKFTDYDAAAMPAEQVLRYAVTIGAEVMGLSDCGCLKAGNKADLIMIDLDMPEMRPLNNIARNIVYSGSKQDVCMTMINGKILYENGSFTTVDKTLVYRKAEEIIARMR